MRAYHFDGSPSVMIAGAAVNGFSPSVSHKPLSVD
jgi:hypothetical protein